MATFDDEGMKYESSEIWPTRNCKFQLRLLLVTLLVCITTYLQNSIRRSDGVQALNGPFGEQANVFFFLALYKCFFFGIWRWTKRGTRI